MNIFRGIGFGVAVVALTTAGTSSAAGGDLLGWADCPPALPYAFADAADGGAHFQSSPVAGPSGGACSLDVVSGADVVPAAGSTGGVAFATPGEVSGGTYTVALDIQFVSGQDPWLFANESGQGDVNGLWFAIPYPGDDCWQHVEYTAPVGPAGGKPVYFVYQDAPGPEEMRIDNMTITPAAPDAPLGLVSSSAGVCTCGPATSVPATNAGGVRRR